MQRNKDHSFFVVFCFVRYITTVQHNFNLGWANRASASFNPSVRLEMTYELRNVVNIDQRTLENQ